MDRTYDARNRLKTLTFPDGRGNQGLTYKPDGRLATISADNGGGNLVTTTYEYNKRRLPVSERLQWGVVDWSYGYNTNGHLASQSQPVAPVINYLPNAMGQPTQAGAYATGVKYFANGAIQQFTYGNGLIHTLTQNVRGLPDTSCDFNGTCNANAALNDGYDYDQNGNVAAISDGRTLNRGNRTMTYDGLDRLKTTVSPMFGNASYAYDALDNMTRNKIGGPAARDHYYCYNANNRLTNVKTGSCNGVSVMGLGYDERGNLANKNGVTFTFDYGNRLRSTTAGASSYVYDGHGRRVRDMVNGGSKYSLYSQTGQLAFASDSRTGKYSNYVYLSGSLVAIREQPQNRGTAATRYLHTDSLGTPVAVTDQSKVVIEKSEYEPYGGLINRPLKDGPDYTGHVADAATGLIHAQQRYLLGGFIPIFASTDSVGVNPNTGGNFGRYLYGANNPYRFRDPDGRVPRGYSDLCASGGGNPCSSTYLATDGISARNISQSEIKRVTGKDQNVSEEQHKSSAKTLAKDVNSLGRMLTKKGDPILVAIFNSMKLIIDYRDWQTTYAGGYQELATAFANFEKQSYTVNSDRYFSRHAMFDRARINSHEFWHLTPSNRQEVLENAGCVGMGCPSEVSARGFSRELLNNYWDPAYEQL